MWPDTLEQRSGAFKLLLIDNNHHDHRGRGRARTQTLSGAHLEKLFFIFPGIRFVLLI